MAKAEATELADAALTQGAQNRANVSSWLATHPGKHSAGAVAEALELHYSTAISHLNGLAESGLINSEKEGRGHLYWWKGNAAAAAAAAAAADDEAKPRRAKRVAATGKDVELVFGDVMVVLGKNPASGRLRIVIEGT